MLVKGKITQWDDDKGFGFIQPLLKGERVFVHIKALQNRSRRPVMGEVVTYAIGKDEQGRLQALQVTFAGEKRKIKAAKHATTWPLWCVLAFAVGLSAAVAMAKLPLYVPLIYAGLSVFTFMAYWLDKRKAQAGQWRTPESTLQFMALLGGWPGALLAQSYLRHKSQKRAFLQVFYLGALLNLIALAWLHSQHMLSAGIGG
ncbi:MAG: cold shock and DUF1294 domain-containing protein [Gammaproteobacteria bacterium]|nr:cold shock and DUF1294 domain-containing protein [Gammaproteobacteria bacterium]MBU1553890.1 cold shock and DUF1294 domain-containing protein [Gammaproteobacteria bacterium]MBU2069065.1 cold shock and DUF1294 domain-containing protein [Gammaproteobacteria bacterium]MBU2182680.1 cold shock and DUF1294 domain-containing protein [Gammaproteobacteria bacterium]MBU2206706.1 cold shock and DUF1294 domain-containing protein [Gammaproteobacteria bacterium]